MTKERRHLFNIALLLFALGGGACAWLMNDNNLFQGATDQQEIARRQNQRRIDLIQAFFIGGTVVAGAGTGFLVLARKITSRRDDS